MALAPRAAQLWPPRPRLTDHMLAGTPAGLDFLVLDGELLAARPTWWRRA